MAPNEQGKKRHIQWDENNLRTNEEYAAANPKMKIDEPKTPFHHGDNPDTAGSPVQRPLASALPVEGQAADGYHEFRLDADIHDPAAISASALERRCSHQSNEDDEGSSSAGALIDQLMSAWPQACSQLHTCTCFVREATEDGRPQEV